MEMQKEEAKMLQWHPAFFAEIQIELQEDAEHLIFENEHQLGTKPKEIDVFLHAFGYRHKLVTQSDTAGH